MGSSFANARLRRTSVRFFSLGGGWLVPFSSGAAFALYNGSTSRSPRRGACARRVPTCGLNCRLPLGAARRRWR